jgi:cysteine desulfurase
LINEIYFDNAATTEIKKEVIDAMLPYLKEQYGNPSAVYDKAINNNKVINEVREKIAYILKCSSDEIYFTSGGTEADNWALKGIAESYKAKGKHIITSKIEHQAILQTCKYLESNGYDVTYLDVDKEGIVDINKLEQAIRYDTIIITIMFANNVIGSIQPIKEIGDIARKHNVIFHTDAVQAFGQLSISVDELNIDLLSASGHKIYGPKGIGFLYISSRIEITPFMHGGSQEKRLRAGTENVPGIVGLGKAAAIANYNLESNMKKVTRLRDYMIKNLLMRIPYSRLNGHQTKRLPNNINISFRFVESIPLLNMLNMYGIYASSGSACSARSIEPSHVLLAMGLSADLANGSLRLTLSDNINREEIDVSINIIVECVEKLRSLTFSYEHYVDNL